MHMVGLITAFAARWQAARVRRVATRELAAMSAGELSDMGITRLDVSRLFESRLVREFRSRGDANRVAAAGKSKLLPQRSAVRTSLETLV
jgi:uncharacterized protein YjiS (DUF1127 family)